jgi:hypothetical protein
MSVIILKPELSYIYFIAPGLDIARAIPVRFFYLQYFDIDGYVEAGYTVL